MDRTGGFPTGLLCGLVRGSPMGLYRKGFRFEGGGRRIIGLNRTGKSCRLRWVNYLHPGLKRGKMTPQEEKLVLELHSKWGNRWSRIARRLPGRTDNEIKNYWRTYMRKKAQERKRAASSSASSSNTCSSESSNPSAEDSLPSAEGEEESFYDTGGPQLPDSTKQKSDEPVKGYSMDDIWKEIAEENNEIAPVHDGYREESCNFSCPPSSWEYSLDSFWQTDEVQKKMFFSTNDQFFGSLF